jgi:hypothetical protein
MAFKYVSQRIKEWNINCSNHMEMTNIRRKYDGHQSEEYNRSLYDYITTGHCRPDNQS